MPGHLPVAAARLDGGDDLGGDAGVDIGAALGHDWVSATGGSEPLSSPANPSRKPSLALPLFDCGAYLIRPGTDPGQNRRHSRQVSLERDPLRLGQPFLTQQPRGCGRGPLPGGPVALGDARVGTAGRLAQADQGRRPIGRAGSLEAERGRGIEEAICERPDMEGAGKACEQGPQPGPIGDHRRQRTERSGGRIQRPGDPWPGGTGRPAAGTAIVEVIEDIVDLPEGALRSRRGSLPWTTGTSCAILNPFTMSPNTRALCSRPLHSAP